MEGLKKIRSTTLDSFYSFNPIFWEGANILTKSIPSFKLTRVQCEKAFPT
jgi:hypothetical protein